MQTLGQLNVSSTIARKTCTRSAILHNGANGARCLIASVACLFGCCSIAMAQPPTAAEREARLFAGERETVRTLQVAQDLGTGFFIQNVSGEAGKPIPIRVQLPSVERGAYNFVVFRYLPEGFSMSAGFSVEDRWVVSLDDLPGLTMTAPKGYRGSFQLEAKLRIGAAGQSQTRMVKVNIGEPGTQQAQAKSGHSTSGGSSAAWAEMERKMLSRAGGLLKTRDVAGARMLYSYLAKKGSGKAAFALGQTYDPDFLTKIGVVGMDAEDVAKAKEWYHRAAELGHKEAQRRLKVLTAGTQ